MPRKRAWYTQGGPQPTGNSEELIPFRTGNSRVPADAIKELGLWASKGIFTGLCLDARWKGAISLR